MAISGAFSGGCNCGAVRYRAVDTDDVVTCYCKQCQRQTSHAVSAVHTALPTLEIQDPKGALRWYAASPGARRGFCSTCGSSLFWQQVLPAEAPGQPGTIPANDFLSVMAGSIDDTTDLALASQIYVDGQAQFHCLDESVPASEAPK